MDGWMDLLRCIFINKTPNRPHLRLAPPDRLPELEVLPEIGLPQVDHPVAPQHRRQRQRLAALLSSRRCGVVGPRRVCVDFFFVKYA
jgi:hypothetical protein